MSATDPIARRDVLLAAAALAVPAVAAEEKPKLGKPKVVAARDGKAVWAMGVGVTVMVRAADTNGAYSVFEDVIPPGDGPPPHVHTKEDETIFVIEGDLTAWLGGVKYEVGPGTWVHMPRNVENYFRNIGEKATRLILTYTPGGFEKWFEDIGVAVKDADKGPPRLGAADVARAVKAAEGYGVTFKKG